MLRIALPAVESVEEDFGVTAWWLLPSEVLAFPSEKLELKFSSGDVDPVIFYSVIVGKVVELWCEAKHLRVTPKLSSLSDCGCSSKLPLL